MRKLAYAAMLPIALSGCALAPTAQLQYKSPCHYLAETDPKIVACQENVTFIRVYKPEDMQKLRTEKTPQTEESVLR